MGRGLSCSRDGRSLLRAGHVMNVGNWGVEESAASSDTKGRYRNLI